MDSKFLPEINKTELEKAQAASDFQAIFDIFVQPLHEEMYKRRDFTFMDELSEGQQLLLSYDYVRMQVLQGGFIQFIQNGYVGLLLNMPEWLHQLGAAEVSKVIDDVLKVYVLNRELLDKSTTVEEFAMLYQELKEFEQLDDSFQHLDADTVKLLAEYALQHPDLFAVIK
ncbi:DMP19 family protein [Polluticoccus soli]|uniref:DMP19 family protein n=1 Tax=Polluticoccus soli TaxID=3034150 RepID=UPI0023E30567|nr:DMP19 family protein [Flavipsychrobacter sp. JY13-12]